ncbi:MAG: hypothetical protein Q4D24_05570 [Erysipelotrichaceae bacterium]|nr:hypothetical protein [Erysipelotrichaceae bacterium]
MEYSRTKKYEELRNHMQNDVDDTLSTEDLSVFQQRLNRMDPVNFEAPMEYTGSRNYDPVHAKNDVPYTQPEPARKPAQPAFEAPRAAAGSRQYRDQVDLNDHVLHGRNENDTSNLLDNDYMNEYIREVKQYNIDQGNALTQDTELNVLKSLKGDNMSSRRPYADDAFTSVKGSQRRAMEQDSMVRPMGPVSQPKQQTAPITQVNTQQDVDIPFIKSDTSSDIDLGDDYLFEKPETLKKRETTKMDTVGGTTIGGVTMTKADIAAQVQSLISAEDDSMELPDFLDGSETNTYSDVPVNTKTQQQLIQETTQMRAQLDDYEENLNDVNDQMSRTNRVLNFVLIVLIIALGAGLAVVLYWILMAKGIL